MDDRERRRQVVEHWAWQLLRRWGVVFRDLLEKEAGAPRWWELTQVYRRLEARGEIRGGRFVHGVAGEQFAMGDTVRELRRLRDESISGDAKISELLVLSAVDPLNLVGVLTTHPRVPSRPSNQIVLLNGRPVAAVEAGEIKVFDECPPQWRDAVMIRCTGIPPESPRDSLVVEDAQPTADGEDRHAPPLRARKRKPVEAAAPSGIPRPTIS